MYTKATELAGGGPHAAQREVGLLYKLARVQEHCLEHGRARASLDRASTLLGGDAWTRAKRHRAYWTAAVAYARAILDARDGELVRAERGCSAAIGAFERAVAPPRGDERALLAQLRNWLGWAIARQGRLPDAASAYERALTDLGPRGHDRERSTLLTMLAATYDAMGTDPARAEALHGRALVIKERLAERDGDWKPLGTAAINLANHRLGSRQTRGVRELLDRAGEIARQTGSEEMRAVVEVNFGELCLLERKPDDALRHLDSAARIADSHDIGWLKAEIARRQDDARQAAPPRSAA
jgi:tetratricopeptide (TPR) repeat protein